MSKFKVNVHRFELPEFDDKGKAARDPDGKIVIRVAGNKGAVLELGDAVAAPYVKNGTLLVYVEPEAATEEVE